MKSFKNILPGLVFTAVIAIISIYFSQYILIGSVTIAIVTGIIINNLSSINTGFLSYGISFSEKTLLSLAIILLGSQININSLSLINYKTILFILFIILFSIIICLLVGKLFGLSKNTSLLIGIGNGICGSAAIAGASKILESKKEEIGISIAVINSLGALCIIAIPLLVNFFPLFDNNQLGLIVGSTVQAFGQVTATGFIIHQDVGQIATVIKMIRILMLGPILIALNIFIKINNNSKTSNSTLFHLPGFIIGFIFMVVLTSFNILSNDIILMLKYFSKFLLTIAMAGIGLKISFNNLLRNGEKIFQVAIAGFIFQIICVFIAVSIL